MAANESEKISAMLPTELREGLHRLAQAHDRTASAELRIALRAHLQRAGDFPGIARADETGRPTEPGRAARLGLEEVER